MLFSQRMNLKQLKVNIQINEMDLELKNGLWNSLTSFYWNQLRGEYLNNNKSIFILVKAIWNDYFKFRIDTLSNYWPETYEKLSKYFYTCKWFEVYDFIEFIYVNYFEFSQYNNNFIDEVQTNQFNNNFSNYINTILERELSAYRLLDGKFFKTTSNEEIKEIEDTINNKYKPVSIHMKRSLELLSDKKKPDYRNSIKESISAVESLCKIISKDDKATLGQALKLIDDKINLHPALKSSFSSLYGYTSDKDGIRHALLDETKLDFEDAKYMLVSCSAFINYLMSKYKK